ncbi:MAG TPA: heterodisulfide reductase [Syntrophobacteraceae bacterium]|nr:heterodisulfide reductase [Syntrophobacteraceae bacterium]
MTSESQTGSTTHISGEAGGPWHTIRETMQACMQCGTCTGSCVNAHAMDYTPRQMWRLVQLDDKAELFCSKTFWLCSTCYYCTLRCPRGLPLTETIGALKRTAVAEGYLDESASIKFYQAFLDSVRRYGRVRETEMMARYFMALKAPIKPMQFTSLGVKLLLKGKLHPQVPRFFGTGKLEALFRKAREVEANP